KDSQVMLNGLKTDLYDYAQGIPADLYEVVESDANLDPVTYINGYSSIIPDKSEAPFDEIEVRQSLNNALDKETIANGVYGNEEFDNMDVEIFDTKQKAVNTDEGTKNYLENEH